VLPLIVILSAGVIIDTRRAGQSFEAFLQR
jgi:hypothetical protein